jgi:hypothetical protein
VLALLKMQFAWPRGADFPLAANWTGCALLSKIALVCVLLSFSLSQLAKPCFHLVKNLISYQSIREFCKIGHKA